MYTKACLIVLALIANFNASIAAQEKSSFSKSAAPVFRKYCTSCHNDEDREGGLSLVTSRATAKGGENGPALLAGNANASRMIRMIRGDLEPRMPPDDMKGPTEKEVQALIKWIDEGAVGDDGNPLLPDRLVVPRIKSLVGTDPVTDLAWSPDGRWIAVARFRRVEILDGKSRKRMFLLNEHPGKVNSVRFSPDSRFLLASTGIAGLRGLAVEWDLESKKKIREFGGHRDVVYSAAYSPDMKQIATAGYDRRIFIWNRTVKSSVEPVGELTGHNGAVYDLQFFREGSVLASASADQTIKLWNVKNGQRLDTLGQPLKEQFATLFHPRLRRVVGAGRDNRIRMWKLRSLEKPAINPILISRYAHESSIAALAFSADGKLLVSAAEDRTIKVWDGDRIELISTLPRQPDVAYGLAFSPDGELAVGRMDGSLAFYRLVAKRETEKQTRNWSEPVIKPNSLADVPLNRLTEAEPNSKPDLASAIDLPVEITGVLHDPESNTDADFFRFKAKKGETWVVETRAAQDKSPADTRIAILDRQGNPVPRVLLQAVRDSYFTFRGKDSSTSDDFRVHNWVEMELNEYLYCNGEVVKLFLYPRGPDSGFKVYPGFGTRHTFFDTTPVTHALQEPCYIVRPLPPTAKPIPNGLPTFLVNQENDDDSERKLGSDSRLFFTAPADGEYLVRINDTRGYHGANYKYKLTLRSARPDFSVAFSGKKMTVKKGSGREFSLTASRIDRYMGPIDVLFENVPPGIGLPRKVTIEANQYRAFGVMTASSEAVQPTPEQIKDIRLTAVARINGKVVRKNLGNFAEIKLEDKPRIQARVVSSYEKMTMKQRENLFTDLTDPVVLKIRAGTTLRADLVVKRHKHPGDIDFGNAESGRNLPHGVFIDNIGLNGLRIIKGQGDVREIFITAAKWVPAQRRLFHLKANNVDGETTIPVLLVVEAADAKGAPSLQAPDANRQRP